jgi:hypothetical protein
MLRVTSRRRLVAPLIIALLAATPVAAAQADPDTNIQKPGHVTVAGSLAPTGGSCSISRPLGDC